MAVNMGETAPVVKAYIARQRLSFPHVLDTTSQVSARLGILATPATLLLDREGRVMAGGMGYRNWATPEVYQLIDSLLNAGADTKAKER